MVIISLVFLNSYTPMMKLWLDDCRPAPEGWIHAKTMEEAQALLMTFEVVEASFDHDLGILPCGKPDCDGYETCPGDHTVAPTGYDLVKWMAENNVWPKVKPKVHSMNPVGRKNMLETIERYFPGETL